MNKHTYRPIFSLNSCIRCAFVTSKTTITNNVFKRNFVRNHVSNVIIYDCFQKLVQNNSVKLHQNSPVRTDLRETNGRLFSPLVVRLYKNKKCGEIQNKKNY